ncbi:uncharacterized protein LTR77_003743 [Saxophila tyrrhenica]|uniref:PhoD-like phosphatase domain-containing protein n=1 Tax=Saxophila tyrrhenica TaxID=1690608 RepID=A0AAV9PF55_9PEZI|nr:hypothetical protein LTR77_003743 [Saxophila tyrrhenica]
MATNADSSNRRQSGLWNQNPTTGYFEKAPTSQSNGPYQYYQPPAADSKPRRSFSDRTGNPTLTSAYLAATQNNVSGASSVLDKSRIKDVALATHAKIASSLHAYSGDAGADDFARSGHAVHVHSPDAEIPKARPLGGDAGKPALSVDPNAVPENVRGTAWSPDPGPTSANTNTRRTSAGNAEVPGRRPSVADKSPLQKLEGKLGDISKEEKRARMEQLENVARQRSTNKGEAPARSNTLRSEKGRAVSDGNRRPSDNRSSDKYQRQVTAGAPKALPPDNGAMRFRRASDALRNGNGSRDVSGGAPDRQRSVRQSAIASNPQPYHHAPEAPRSLGVAYPQPGAGRQVSREAQPYHHAPEAPTSVNVAGYPHNANRGSRDGASRSVSNPVPPSPNTADRGGLERTASGKYKRRLRDAGFVGAAAMAGGAAGGATAHEYGDPDRGREAYEKRKSAEGGEPLSPVSTTGGSRDVGRSGSRKLQKPYPWRAAQGRRSSDRGQPEQQYQQSPREQQQQQPQPQQQYQQSPREQSYQQQQQYQQSPREQQQPQQQSRNISTDPVQDKSTLQTNRMGDHEKEIPPASEDPDPIARATVATGPDIAVPYSIPPQTAAGQEARAQVGFHDEPMAANMSPEQKHHHFGGMFHRDENKGRGYVKGKALEEWKGGKPVRLTAGDLDFMRSSGGGDDGYFGAQKDRRSSSGGVAAAQYAGPYEEEAKSFHPPLFLKCGPLLRYTGMRKEMSSSGRGEREIWRGSVMIVTEDEQSDISSPPTLRLFAQPAELHTPPERHGFEVAPEDEDPVAGQVKISRTGRPLYVRPVHDLDGEVDLSREENNSGLYSATRAPMLGPQFSSGSDGRQSQHITFQDKSRIRGRDGEKAGRYREIKAVRLHAERGFTFWRWSLEVELGSTPHRVAYRINKGPALGFWVPARGESMNVLFHSCNGFSMSVDPDTFSGPDPLWRDVLNRHQHRPFHVMLGGGDQIYNDAAMRDTTLFREWLQTKNPEHKHHAPFSVEMQEELESFYFHRYSMWFSQGLFAMAASQVPMVNMWDDHDIIDGFGSYPHHFMSTPVFTGVGAVAFKYYMLFQHQSLVAETAREEPSWVLGASPGPYINELSRSIFLSLGQDLKLLALDCRTERMRDEILSQQSYDILFDRARTEIRKGDTKHLLVLLGVPIAYPRLNFLENILTSRALDPIKALGRTGMLGGFVNKFDGGVEILDDLDDHWTAKHHKAERNWFIQELQELAAEKSVRVTILGGDVHLGAVGQFYTPRKLGVAKDRDHRYMPNVVSSAIVNTPPPVMMADVLNKRNKVHHLDGETDEDMIPMFEVDVDGSKRNNKCLLPRRNYCTIRQWQPGSTPPSTPPPEDSRPGTGYDGQEGMGEGEERDRRYPPGSMSRTRSLTGMPGRLVRRLSGSGRSKNPPSSLERAGTRPGMGRSSSLSGLPRNDGQDGGAPQRPTNTFMRRPTNLSEKEIRRAAERGGAPDDEDGEAAAPGHVNLEGGLDVSLNMEVDQHDPAGTTRCYRLLVPALRYEGAGDVNTASFGEKKVGFLDRLRGKGKRDGRDEEEEDYSSEEGDERDESTPPDSRGQGQQQQQQQFWGQQPAGAVAARGTGRQPHGTDGAYDAPRGSVDNPPRSGGAYQQGYDLASPPLGSSRPTQASAGSNNNNDPYPTQQQQPPTSSSGPWYRRVSAPFSQKHAQRVPSPSLYNRGRGQDQDEYSDEGSFTPSDEYEDGDDRGYEDDEGPQGRTPGQQPRRLSKAERFFGMGEEGSGGSAAGGGYGNGNGEDREGGGRRGKWKIWK